MHLLLWNNMHLFNQMQLHKKFIDSLYMQKIFISMDHVNSHTYNMIIYILKLLTVIYIYIEGKNSNLQISLSQRSNKVLILMCNI